MKRKIISVVTLVFALATLSAVSPVDAVTMYGGIGNFDAVNDTGVEAHGFEIEFDDTVSTSIGGTYDWNHYGKPTITQDNSDPAHPKSFIRHAATYNSITKTWSAYTAFPVNGLPATQGHQCTNPAVNEGCEHFCAYSMIPASSMTYSWLIEDSAHPGTLIRAPKSLVVANPTWTWTPPVPAQAQPAQVVAVMPAPVVIEPPPPVPPLKPQWGEPSFVKVIKTKTHNANKVAIADLIGGDKNGDGKADWANGAQQEVESEWYLLQTKPNGDGGNAKEAHHGAAENVNPGEQITRRYEFYKYAGSAATIDGETGEAMCDEVGPDGIHGLRTDVTVTDANGDTQTVDCTQEVVVGDYTGAHMVGFEEVAALTAIDNIEDGQIGKAYVDRTVVYGGNTPYVVIVDGVFPAGLTIDSSTGILSGTPTEGGVFNFTVNATDADNTKVTQTYTININDANGNPVASAPTISTAMLDNGVEETAYYMTLTEVSGTAPFTWSVNPALPTGLSLSADGVLSGTPAIGTRGVESYTFTVTDKNGKFDSKSLTLTIAAKPCSGTQEEITSFINIGSLALPPALTTATGAYRVRYPNQANTIVIPPAQFQVGALVTYAGTLDASGVFCEATTMTVEVAPLVLGAVDIPTSGLIGSAFNGSATATGGVPAVTWTASNLPTGLSISANGIVTGTPTMTGAYNYTVVGTDTVNQSVTTSGTITISAPALVLGSVNVPKSGTLNVAYNGSVTATGGVPVINWTATNLPTGLSISAAGVISGIPTAAGSYNYTLLATDAANQSVTTSGTITINPPALVLGAVTIPSSGTVGVAYNGSVTATGGVPAINWTATNLPTGLIMSAAGIISGTPTTAGAYNYMAIGKDAVNQTVSTTGTITIAAQPVPPSTSCTLPKGAKKAHSKAKVTAVGVNYVKVGTVFVDYAACSQVEINGGATVPKIGDIAEYEGYVQTNGRVFAKYLTFN